MQAMNWDDLRHLLAIARAGTLAAAARRLRVNQTTVARRLGALEAALGARLFERGEGVLRPTKPGELALARAAEVEQEVQALEQGVAGADGEPAGLVRMTAVPILVNRLLIPAVAALNARHPRLRLELIAESRNLSLTRREADIALRLSRPESGAGAIARRLVHLDYAIYGPRGRPGARLPWITYEEALSHLPQARWIAQLAEGGELAPLAVSDAEALIHATQAGLGKSLLPCVVADRETGLRRLGEPVLRRELWLLTHRELRHHARIAAAIAWIEDVLDRGVRQRHRDGPAATRE
jgi:DNA-binding transcriptional LysR family regulator